MDLYQDKAMRMSKYEIIVEYDKLIHEIEDKQEQLNLGRKKYSGLFSSFKKGYSEFKSIERVTVAEIKNNEEKMNVLAKAIYSVREVND